MEISKRYNSVLVKDNCTLFSPTSLFSEPGYPTVSFKFLPCRPLLPWQRILGQKLTTTWTWPSWKIIACCFHLHPYFRARAIRWCHLYFSPADPHYYGNKFLDKIDYNSAPAKDNCTLFSFTLYFRAWAMQWCHVNFSAEDPYCHGNQPFLRQNWLQAHKSVKRWNAAARLYSVAMGQIPRSTERISSIGYKNNEK